MPFQRLFKTKKRREGKKRIGLRGEAFLSFHFLRVSLLRFLEGNDLLLNLRRLLEPIMMSGLSCFALVLIMHWLKEHESCL